MNQQEKLAPEDIRRARADNWKLRGRDLAIQLCISEAELVAGHCGDDVMRIDRGGARGLEAPCRASATNRLSYDFLCRMGEKESLGESSRSLVSGEGRVDEPRTDLYAAGARAGASMSIPSSERTFGRAATRSAIV